MYINFCRGYILNVGVREHICRGGGGQKFCPTETESARLLLSYKIDLISVYKGLENITCIIWHIIDLYTCFYGYMNGLISYLPESEVAVTLLYLFSRTTGGGGL